VVLLRALGAEQQASGGDMPPALAAAGSSPHPHPIRALIALLKGDGVLAPASAAIAMLLWSLGTAGEALLLRSMGDSGRYLSTWHQRALGLAAIVTALLAITLFQSHAVVLGNRFAYRIEARFRIRFSSKLPRIGDSYFRSRPASDMAERAHATHLLRLLPQIGQTIVSAGIRLIVIACGLCWLVPQCALAALTTVTLSVAIPLLVNVPGTSRSATWPRRCASLSSHSMAPNANESSMQPAFRTLGVTVLGAHGSLRV
jgi:ATP-binding cassette subfamily B protein